MYAKGLGQNERRRERLWQRITPAPEFTQTIDGELLARPTTTTGEPAELGSWVLPAVAITALYFLTRK